MLPLLCLLLSGVLQLQRHGNGEQCRPPPCKQSHNLCNLHDQALHLQVHWLPHLWLLHATRCSLRVPHRQLLFQCWQSLPALLTEAPCVPCVAKLQEEALYNAIYFNFFKRCGPCMAVSPVVLLQHSCCGCMVHCHWLRGRLKPEFAHEQGHGTT
jgi:hypothetical protein